MKLNQVNKNSELIGGAQIPNVKYFDLTLVIDKDNKLQVVDNSVKDANDLIDMNTLVVKQVKVNIH